MVEPVAIVTLNEDLNVSLPEDEVSPSYASRSHGMLVSGCDSQRYPSPLPYFARFCLFLFVFQLYLDHFILIIPL